MSLAMEQDQKTSLCFPNSSLITCVLLWLRTLCLIQIAKLCPVILLKILWNVYNGNC